MTDEGVEQRGSTVRTARRVGALFVAAAAILGFVSFLVLLGLTPIEPEGTVLTVITAANVLVTVVLALLVWREARVLLTARRRGRGAARLHIRIVGLFGIVAALPAIVVAVIAGITLDQGLDRLFAARTNEIVQSSVSVARSYLGQSAFTARGTTVAMAQNLSTNDLRRVYNLDRAGFVQFMGAMTRARGLLSAQLLETDGTVLETVSPLPDVEVKRPPPDALAQLRQDQVAIVPPERYGANVVGVIVPMPRLRRGLALYTTKLIDPTVLKSIELMQERTREYDRLQENSVPLQIALATLYVAMCLVVLLGAIWLGFGVAERIIQPIRRLIAAADRVRAGDLGVVVEHHRSEGDLRSLTDTFNRMVVDLREQRNEILDTQRQSDARRRFTEAVLAGVSTGVIGVMADGNVSIANGFAGSLVGLPPEEMHDRPLSEMLPEISEVLGAGMGAREQITLRRGGEERTLIVQLTDEATVDGERASVVTLDDITDLILAQRTSAWADVARRIAHEIKNPLTPIQLSAERIRRRYGKRITEDREVFDQCLETIVRQVGDIGRMVDEFSSFARMPKPVMTIGDLAETAREAVFLRRVGAPDVTFETDLPEGELIACFDDRMIGQAIGNLAKNAAEAMEGALEDGEQGRVLVTGHLDADEVVLDIVDNGRGLPVEDRQRLLEPYMTTREKGTGLGLAIVSKILDEHGGRLELLDADTLFPGQRGALIRLRLPAAKNQTTSENEGSFESRD